MCMFSMQLCFLGLFAGWVPGQGGIKASSLKAGNLEAPEQESGKQSIVLTAQKYVALFIFKIKDKIGITVCPGKKGACAVNSSDPNSKEC